MDIIRVKPSDWNKIRRSIKSIEKKAFELEMRFAEYLGDFKPFKDPESINLIIKHNGRIAGYLMSSMIERDRRFTKHKRFGKKDTISLDSIAIRPEYQGKGMGRKLLRSFMTRAKKKKLKYIILDATSAGMLKLAESEGFKHVKFYRKWDGLRPNWHMEKKIN